MFEHIIYLILMYMYLFFVGFGCYCFLTPKYLQKTFMLPFLAPFYGLMLMSIINVYYMYSNSHVTKSIYSLAVIGLVTLLLAVFYKKEIFSEAYNRIKSCSKFDFFKITLFIAVLALILSPSLRAGYPTTPYRIGIDQAGYAEAAKFLLDGGTYKQAGDNLKAQLNETDVLKALKKERLAISQNSVIDAEFTVNWPRCGYHTVVATISSFVNSNHVYETEFILLIFPYALIFALGYFLLRHKLGCSSIFSYLAALALVLNCNMLNLYYEGQYAQIFVIPMFVLLLISYLLIRESEQNLNLKSMFSPNSNYSIIFPSLLVAAIGSCYFESLILLVGFCVVTVIYDFVFLRKVKYAFIIPMITACFLGLTIIMPQSIKMTQAMIRLYSQFSTAGFWQPKWASIPEILGIFNIYTPDSVKIPYALLLRNNFDLLINIFLSVVIAAFIFIAIKKDKSIDKSFWLASPTLILLVYLKSRSFEHLHNYQYMKTYTIFLPLLFVLSFAAIDFVSRLSGNVKKKVINLIKYIVVTAVIFSGLSYIHQYDSEAGYVTKDMYALNTLSKTVDLDSYAIFVEKSGIAAIKEHMLISLIPFNWINYSDNQFVKPFLSKNVLIIIDRNKFDYSKLSMKKYEDNIIYSNPSYILLDTKIPLSRGYDYKTDRVKFEYFLEKFDLLNK